MQQKNRKVRQVLVAAQVHKELTELKKLGIRVPKKAFEVATREAAEFVANGMSVSEIADLCINRAQV